MQKGSYPPPPPPPPPDEPYYREEPEIRESPRRRKRKSRALSTAITLLVVLLLLFLLFFTPLGEKLNDLLVPGQTIPEYADIVITRTIDVTVNGGEINYTLDLPKPEEINAGGSPIQEISSITTNPQATVVLDNGTYWYVWTDVTSSDFTVSVTYNMRVHTISWDIKQEDSGTVDDIPDSLDKYTWDEWKIVPNSTTIKNLAESLTRQKDTVYDMVKAVYDYMDTEFTYVVGTTGIPKDCQDTLRDKSGDCDEQSILFCSLLRAVGIPAWLEFGPLYDSVKGEWGPHAWMKVYMPLVDGGGGTITIDIVNDQFMVRDCRRFTEWESDGNGDHLSDYYSQLSWRYDPTHAPYVLREESYSGSYSPSANSVKIPSNILVNSMAGLIMNTPTDQRL